MEVFFYGLFMDGTILEKNGIRPSNRRKGCLNDYALKIGKRASLVPCENDRSYGIVMTADSKAIRKLYAQPGVDDYIPEEVNIVTSKHDVVTAVCYNLPIESLSGTNEVYALSLYELAKKEGFPIDYLEKIKKMARTTV
ncbi:MAG: gamma-glutamylcyclotransferase family protein [Cyclobacteriaceae bacterium]